MLSHVSSASRHCEGSAYIEGRFHVISNANKFELLSCWVKIAIVLQLACRKVLSMLSQPLKFISDKFMSEFEDTENLKIPKGCTVGLYTCSWVKHAEATSWWPIWIYLTPCFSGAMAMFSAMFSARFSAMFRSLSAFPIVPSVKSGWVDCLAAWLAWELESSRGSWMDTPHPQTVLQDVLQHVGPSFLDFLR